MDENKSYPSADVLAGREAENADLWFPPEFSRWTLPSIPDEDAPALSEILVRLHGIDPCSPRAELMRGAVAEADPATRHLMLTVSFLQNKGTFAIRQSIDLMWQFNKSIDEQYEDAGALKSHRTARIGLILAANSNNMESCFDALDKLWENSTRPILGIMSALFSAIFQKEKNKDGQMVCPAHEHNSMAKAEKSIREDMNTGPKTLFFSGLFLLLSAAFLGLMLFSAPAREWLLAQLMFLKLPSFLYLGMVALLVIILFNTKGCLAAFLSTCIFMVSPALVLLFVLHSDDETLLVPCFIFCLLVVVMIVVLFCSFCPFFDNITWRKKHARARRKTEELRGRLTRILENMDKTHPVLSRPDIAVMKYCCAVANSTLPEFCRMVQQHWNDAHSFYQELYDRLPQ